ncbi:MAG: hypothetical protein KAI81_04285 [Candidatus Marinimicrobia bacterium]|nr:hypothetical protein [Candidatus Neomarinimicrobiota bacterium]
MLRKLLFLALVSLTMFSACADKKTDKSNPATETVEAIDLFLNSSEYKLLLSPAKFTNPTDAFAEYWEVIKKVAGEEGIPVLAKEKPLKEKHKAVSFLDTKNLDLRKNGFLLRHKRTYKGNDLALKVEYTLKYRNRLPEKVRPIDMSIGEGYTAKHEEIELESDIVYSSVLNGALDATYTVGNAFDSEEGSVIKTVGDIAKRFPVLNTVKLDPETELVLAANVIADERMVQMGHLDFGDGLMGRMDMAIWTFTTEDGKEISVPEFSFDHPFSRDKEYSKEAMNKCASFINKLETATPDWIEPGVLKAAVIFNIAEKGLSK